MYRKLYRSKNDVKISGVCAGLANYYDVDPTIVRLATVLVAFVTAIIPMIILYFIAWAIIPIEE